MIQSVYVPRGFFKPHKQGVGQQPLHARPRDGSGRLGTARDRSGRTGTRGGGRGGRKGDLRLHIGYISYHHGYQLIYTGSYNTTAAVRACDINRSCINDAFAALRVERVANRESAKRTHLPSESEGFALETDAVNIPLTEV